STAASATRVGIHDLKTGPGQAFTKIQSSAAQIFGALAVDEKLYPVALDDFVARLFLVERHLVIQARAAAFVDLHAQTFPYALLLDIEQTAQLPRRVLGDVYHRPANYDLTATKSKKRAESERRFSSQSAI